MKNPRPSELICVVLLSLAICLGERHELMAQESHMPAFQARACITAQEVVQNLVRMNAERAEALQAYEGTRVYRLDYRGFPGSRRAEMVVRVKYRSPLTKEFLRLHAWRCRLGEDREAAPSELRGRKKQPKNGTVPGWLRAASDAQ